MEHVAGYLGLDASLVRQRNFMYPKDLPSHPYAAPALKPQVQPHQTGSVIKDEQNCNGKAEFLNDHIEATGGSADAKGSPEAKGKTHTTPDVVCGRFQLKQAEDSASELATVSSGR